MVWESLSYTYVQSYERILCGHLAFLFDPFEIHFKGGWDKMAVDESPVLHEITNLLHNESKPLMTWEQTSNDLYLVA